MDSPDIQPEVRLKGLGISSGVALGRVCLFNEWRHSNTPTYQIESDDVAGEIQRVREAAELAIVHLDQVRRRVAEKLGSPEAGIFVAQKMILQDHELHDQIAMVIRTDRANAEAAVAEVLDGFERQLLDLEDEHLRARATDIGEIKQRLLDVMADRRPSLVCNEGVCRHGRNRVLVAGELTPAMTVELDVEDTVAFVTTRGGINSHAAILARALGVPAVSNIVELPEMLQCGAEVLVDGSEGLVIVNPTLETIAVSGVRQKSGGKIPQAVPPVEGFRVMANISQVSEVEEAVQLQAEGVGLYRTEFEVIAAGRLFTEDELVERYTRVVRAMKGHATVFRLLDIGSDKVLPCLGFPPEENPALGWRGTRLLLSRPELMRPQARALARVSQTAPIHVLYPMIVDACQFEQAVAAFTEAIADIESGKIYHGAMFEVPSACLDADAVFERADFGSVGTNDLTQYLFAVDRDNERVSGEYDHDRPVFWRLIKSLADAANRAGKMLSVCGELAGSTAYTAKLLDLGIRCVSTSPRRIPRVRRALTSSSL